MRARRSQGGPDDTVVKLDRSCRRICRRSSEPPEFGVEVDALPGGYVCSASFKAELKKNRVRATTLGERPISKLFSAGQRTFFDAHAPAGHRTRPALHPRSAERAEAEVRAGELRPPMVVELWLYPDGSRVLELSTKCRPTTLSRPRPKPGLPHRPRR